jgi:putative chitobiose transport system permease protein
MAMTETKSGGNILNQVLSAYKREKEVGRTNPFGYLFIAPALILYIVFNLWPMIRGFLMAFTDYRFISESTRWDLLGLANFAEIFTDDQFLSGLSISLRYLLMYLPSMFILSLLLAVLISRVRAGGQFYRWAVYLPTILPIAVTLLMFKQLYNFKFGFFNSVLVNLGSTNPPDWLGETASALPALVLADLWRGFGFPTLLFLIGIYNISQELYEAASIDGAGWWQQLTRITIPLLKPTFALIIALNIGAIGATESMLVLTNGGPQASTLTLGLYIYQVAFQLGDLRLGYAAAMSLLLGLASALITFVSFRLLRQS